jgi:hypothetical protein
VICGLLGVLGVVALVVGALVHDGDTKIPLLVFGSIAVLAAFFSAQGVRRLRAGASEEGGVEVAADIPIAYTREIKVSPSLSEGRAPPKLGIMPPVAGHMPPKEAEPPKSSQPSDDGEDQSSSERLRASGRAQPEGSSREPPSSAKP